MKNLTNCFLFSLLLFGCTQMEPGPEQAQSGEVRFTAVSLHSFSGNMPNGKTEAASSWKHIFQEQATLEVTNQNTGQRYTIDYNPNNLGTGFTLSLPFGSYSYSSEVEGGDYCTSLPFRIEGEFNLHAGSLDIVLNATTDYGLITVRNEYVSSLGIRDGAQFLEMALSEDGSHYFIYAKNGLGPVLEINEMYGNQLITRQISVEAYSHYHYYLRLGKDNGSANFIELALGKFELVEEGIEIGEGEADTFTDPRDGQTYRTVRIGEQIWMAENLNYETGDSWCYDEDPANCAKYGRLYYYETALTACPEGWHLPSMAEWVVLADYLGGIEFAGAKMKSIDGWPPNTGGTNESGFSGLPGGEGEVSQTDISFGSIRSSGNFWSSDKYWIDEYSPWVIFYTMLNLNSGSLNGGEITHWGPVEVEYLSSCRCIKDVP